MKIGVKEEEEKGLIADVESRKEKEEDKQNSLDRKGRKSKSKKKE